MTNQRITSLLLIGGLTLLTGCSSADSFQKGYDDGRRASTTTTIPITSTTANTSGYKMSPQQLNPTRTTLDYRGDNEGCVDASAGDPEPDDFEEFCD